MNFDSSNCCNSWHNWLNLLRAHQGKYLSVENKKSLEVTNLGNDEIKNPSFLSFQKNADAA